MKSCKLSTCDLAYKKDNPRSFSNKNHTKLPLTNSYSLCFHWPMSFEIIVTLPYHEQMLVVMGQVVAGQCNGQSQKGRGLDWSAKH